MKSSLPILFLALTVLPSVFAKHLVHNDYSADLRDANTPGYYLGFTSFHDKFREVRLPTDIKESSSFFNSFYIDFHYANQEFSEGFYALEADPNKKHHIEHTLYGITLGFGLGDNPNLDVRIPLSISDFQVDHLDDTGFVGGIELFPNYRINEYVAWGVNFAHLNSVSDFPIFDESMTSVSFEAMAESSPAYGMNWSGRLSMGHYYPSNDINENSFWLWKGSLGLHYQLHEDFTFLPYFRINYSPTEAAVTDTLWVDYGIEFLLMPNSPWNFSFGLAGIGGHDVIEEGMEFYLSTKGNF
ncbi:MAG: hypothetical protein ACO3UY_04270 [Opitutales bacterium]|jgi:hypothetical protein